MALVCTLLTAPGKVGAQTWSWGSVSTPSYGPALQTQSTVALSRNTVSFSSVAPNGNRRIVLASCHAALRDVQRATAVSAQGQAFILIEFKPQRGANCDSGKKTIASLPSDDFAQAGEIATAVNNACCTTAAPQGVRSRPATTRDAHSATAERRRTVAQATQRPKQVAANTGPTPAPNTPPPSPAPRPSPAPPPSASPVPVPTGTAAPAEIRVVDWTEAQGPIAFVRVYNAGSQAVTVADGRVLECGSGDIRCGAVPQRRTIKPRSIATIAVVASTGQHEIPPFSYRYTAGSGTDTISLHGSSAKARPARIWPLSHGQTQAALAGAGVELRSSVAAPPTIAGPNDSPPRLLTRGSSKLAIGHKGVALVRIFVTADGTPQQASVISTNNPLLTAAAIETAASSTYAPATKFGRPVGANYVATFSFDGEDPADAAIPVWKRSVPIWRRSPVATPPPATTTLPRAATPSTAPATTSRAGS